MSNLETIGQEYFELLSQQQFNEDELDYAAFERQKIFLKQLSEVGNSGISVFDLFRKEHVFTSYNFSELFGYDLKEIEENGTDYFNSKIHPEDFLKVLQNGIEMMKFLYQLPKGERPDYKLICEYRILNSEAQYVRVIEQQQALELDMSGNVWLALSVIDLSPNQENHSGIKSQLINYKTGKALKLVTEEIKTENINRPGLTKREREVLQLVKDGFLSKEISEKLSISFHTVNTHRQRILGKLEVDNSMEAVDYASKIGLLR